jgi:butyrate kinase
LRVLRGEEKDKVYPSGDVAHTTVLR